MDQEVLEIPNSVIVLTPSEEMLRWLNSYDDEPLTLAEVTKDPTAVLVPDIETDEILEEFLETHWKALFEMMLGAWYIEETWPKHRTYKMFRSFVDVVLCSIAYQFRGDSTGPTFGKN